MDVHGLGAFATLITLEHHLGVTIAQTQADLAKINAQCRTSLSEDQGGGIVHRIHAAIVDIGGAGRGDGKRA